MQWVRSNRRFGAWCALAAIALQIVLTFGHAHRIEELRPAGLFRSAAAAVQMVVEREPAQLPVGPAVEYCAVCTVINMAAASIPPEAPAAGVPALAGEVRFAPAADAVVRTAVRRLFQARAPPAA